MKKLKVLLSTVVAFAIVFACIVTAYAYDSVDYDAAFEFASEFLTEYYYAVNVFDDYDFTKYIESPLLLEFVNGKVIDKQAVSIAYGTDYIQDFTFETELIESKELGDNFIWLRIATDERYYYKFMDVVSDTMTSVGRECQVIIENRDGLLILKDWYTLMYGYDADVRDGQLYLTIDDPYFWDDESNAEELTSLISESISDITVYWESIASPSEPTFELVTDIVVPEYGTESTLYSLDRTAMVNWALANCTAVLPSSENSSIVPYVDFSTVSDTSWDCTNFASHALLAGGAVPYDTGGSGKSSTGWYYRDMNNRSYSWSGVEYFYDFLTSYNPQGPSGREITFTPINSTYTYNLGDIFQFSYEGDWSHTTIITGFVETDEGLVPKVTGRSSVTVRENDQLYSIKYSELNGTKGYRIIKLWGYLI